MLEQKEMVTIAKAEYERLLERDRELAILDDAGVDNWEGNHLRYMSDEDYQAYCEGAW